VKPSGPGEEWGCLELRVERMWLGQMSEAMAKDSV